MAPSFSFGLVSLLSMLLSGGMITSGLPLGMPPTANDPMIGHVAPEDCLAYFAWNGMAFPSAESENYTEQLLANSEVRRFTTEVTQRLLKSIRNNAGEDMQPVAEELPKLLQVLLTSPTAIYISTPAPLPAVGIVCRVEDKAKDIEQALVILERTIGDEPGRVTESNGVKIHNWPVAPNAPPLQWGIVDDCVVIAFGPNEFAKLVARRKAASTPEWLTEIHARLPVERFANIIHFNTKSILKNASPFLQSYPNSLRLIEALGLNQVESVNCVTGLDAKDCVARTWIKTTGSPKGLLKFAKANPLTKKELNVVPADSRVAVAFRLDPVFLFKGVQEIADVVEPGSSRQIRSELSNMESAFGLDLEEDILASLGNSWRIYQSEAEGGSLFTGWTGVVSLRDSGNVRNLVSMAKGFIAAQNSQFQNRSRRVRMQSYKSGGNDVVFLNFIGEEFPFAPALCVTENELIVSLFPQGVTAYLNRSESTPRLTQVADFDSRFQNRSVALIHYDTKAIFNSAYPLMQMGANFLLANIQREGIDVDISLLPSLPAISQHLQPGAISLAYPDDGIELMNRRTLPAGIETVAFAAPAMLFGARSRSRFGGPPSTLSTMLSPTKARLAQSKNNLKQIGLAFHNYHDVYTRFAPSATKDKEGNRGLSWRVQLLPFLGQADLYNQFRMDEPWDSEHNKQLIPKIPSVYQTPGAKTDTAVTNYVGLSIKNSILPPDGDGTGLRDITDGTSNTIMVVEADDNHAVIWTKPEDLEFDTQNPRKGLSGIITTDAFHALLADGSVRLISKFIDEQTLRHLVIRNDGNVIGDF